MNSPLYSNKAERPDEVRLLEAEIQSLRQDNAALRGVRRNLAVSKLTDSEIQAILDNWPSLIGYVDINLTNVFGNKAYADWFGLDLAKLPTMHAREVIGENLYRLNLPYMEAALRGETQEFERTIPYADGTKVRYVLAKYIPNFHAGKVQGFFVLLSDITYVKEMEAKLQRNEAVLKASEARYRSVVQDQTEMITRVTPDGHFLFVNEVFCRFFGKSEAEIVGTTTVWHPCAYEEDRPRIFQELSDLAPDNPVVSIENRVVAATGAIHWMQFIHRGHFDMNGNLLELQSVGRDITRSKNAETQLRVAHDELKQRVQQLRKLALDATVSEDRERKMIAHDLHDDIGQILHVAKLKLDSLAKAAPDNLSAAAKELGDLIGDASKTVRSLTSQLSPPGLKDLGLLWALRWLAQEQHRLYGIAVDCELDDTSTSLAPDLASVIFRIARELLINVAKHAKVDEARLTAHETGLWLEITVGDNGIGIPNVAPPAGSQDSYGLQNIQERVAYLGGQFTIQSSPGRGTLAIMRVPILSPVIPAWAIAR